MELYQEYFTVNALNKQVKQISKPCDTCLWCKDNNNANVGEMCYIVPKKKGGLISIDYYGLLPT